MSLRELSLDMEIVSLISQSRFFFLHSLKTLFLSTFTVGAKPETRVQSAAAASTKSYEIRSKIACLPHRHAKQPASQGGRTCLAADFPQHLKRLPVTCHTQGPGSPVLVRNTQRASEPMDRAPGTAALGISSWLLQGLCTASPNMPTSCP